MPPGVKAIAVLMAVATLIAIAAAITLLVPGTPVDGIWAIKKGAYQQMLSFRWLAGTGFVVLAIATLCAAIGLWRGRRLGWFVAIAVFGLNGLSDLARAFSGDAVGGAIGVLIAAALVVYLTRPAVRARLR